MTAIRRTYLLRRLRFSDQGERGLASAYLGKQLAEPGTPLPEAFPAREKLTAAGYVAIEDVQGANERELERAGLTPREALAVLSVLDEWEN